jgi:hypothetical protein
MPVQEVEVRDFTRVEIAGAIEVEISQAGAFSVSLDAEEDALKRLRVTREGVTLRVTHSKYIDWWPRTHRPRVYVVLPVLNELSLAGASKARLRGLNAAGDLKLRLTGASEIEGDIRAVNARFELYGASTMELKGSTENLTVEAVGASQVELRDFMAHNADIRLSGASRGTVNLNGILNARLIGASQLHWLGQPTMGDIKTIGFSNVSRKA